MCCKEFSTADKVIHRGPNIYLSSLLGLGDGSEQGEGSRIRMLLSTLSIPTGEDARIFSLRCPHPHSTCTFLERIRPFFFPIDLLP